MLINQISSPVTNTGNLIALTLDREGNQAVSARILHAFLAVKRDFTNWCKQMFEYDFIEGQDYYMVYVAKNGDVDNQAFKYSMSKRNSLGISTDYILSLECGKEIAMLQRSEKGKLARRYFIECERALKNITTQSTTITALVGLVNDLMAEVISLKAEVKHFSKKQEKYHQAQVVAETDQKKQDIHLRRERIMAAVSMKIRCSNNLKWSDFWDAFEKTYHVNVRALPHRSGEHPLDVAIRFGYINLFEELLGWQ